MDTPSNGNSLNDDQQQQVLFMMLVQQHQQIAMMGMGKIKNPVTDKIERDLKTAKFAIDTLNMLNTFTKGNLPKELEDYFNQTLTNLRLNYADEKKKGEGASAGDGSTGGDANNGGSSDNTESDSGNTDSEEGSEKS